MRIKKTKEPSKLDKLRLLAAECNKALGADGKVTFADDIQIYERLPTGILAFDSITGGGLVRCHLTELYGEESSGKTLLALHAVASVQKRQGVAVWVKGEDFDPPWARRQGVDTNKLIIIESSTGDKALETACTLLEDGDPDLVVFDSYQALGTTREAEGGVDSEAYAGGGAPQLWGRVMRRAYAAFNSKKTTAALLGISQVRDAIGGFSPNGRPEPKPTQIRALKHWKSISVQCKKGEPTYTDPKSDKRRLVAREFHLKCVKNKTAPPERVSSFVYNFKEWEGGSPGVDFADEVLRLGKVHGLLEQKGGWIHGYGEKAHGDAAFKERIKGNYRILKELRTDILSAIKQ